MNAEELRKAIKSLSGRGRRVKPETEWLYFVRKRLNLAFGSDCRLVKIRGGLGQERGIPDLIGVIKGRGVALELKTPSGRHKLSQAQSDFLTTWTAAGGLSMVIDSPEALEGLIKNFGKETRHNPEQQQKIDAWNKGWRDFDKPGLKWLKGLVR